MTKRYARDKILDFIMQHEDDKRLYPSTLLLQVSGLSSSASLFRVLETFTQYIGWYFAREETKMRFDYSHDYLRRYIPSEWQRYVPSPFYISFDREDYIRDYGIHHVRHTNTTQV